MARSRGGWPTQRGFRCVGISHPLRGDVSVSKAWATAFGPDGPISQGLAKPAQKIRQRAVNVEISLIPSNHAGFLGFRPSFPERALSIHKRLVVSLELPAECGYL